MKMHGDHKMCYHLCFKCMSRLQTSLVLAPEDNKVKEITEFCEFGGFLCNIEEIMGICLFPDILRKSAIRVEMVENTYGKPIGFQRFGASARNRTRFRGKCKIYRILQKS